jgi:hypothetical protein
MGTKKVDGGPGRPYGYRGAHCRPGRQRIGKPGRLVLVAVVGLSLAVVATACGSSRSSSPGGAGTGTTTTGGTPLAAPPVVGFAVPPVT